MCHNDFSNSDSRQEALDDFVTNLAANNAAVELLGMVQNRMNKFYNHKMLYDLAASAKLFELRCILFVGVHQGLGFVCVQSLQILRNSMSANICIHI